MSCLLTIGHLKVANDLPLTLIAGPCVIENRDHALKMATELRGITEQIGMGFIYKSSFDKANRTRVDSPRGVGFDTALKIFEDIRREVDCPLLTDIHTPEQCEIMASVVDVLQIPAFLCRQTDLLTSAGHTGKVINVKKGQFLAPWDMENVVDKISSTGNKRIMVCERGTSFGYNTLIADMRSLPILAKNGYPVVFDATHSVQQPGGLGSCSGGQREFAPVLARGAVSIGVAAVFIETHDNPDNALSDGPNMVRLSALGDILKTLQRIDTIAKTNPIDLGAWA